MQVAHVPTGSIPVIIDGKHYRLIPDTSHSRSRRHRSDDRPVGKPKGHQSAKRAPRVAYVRLLAIYDKAVQALPPGDQAVARLISMSGAGTTRAELLKARKAHKHTGKVDGAVRRLRLAGVIRVEHGPSDRVATEHADTDKAADKAAESF